MMMPSRSRPYITEAATTGRRHTSTRHGPGALSGAASSGCPFMSGMPLFSLMRSSARMPKIHTAPPAAMAAPPSQNDSRHPHGEATHNTHIRYAPSVPAGVVVDRFRQVRAHCASCVRSATDLIMGVHTSDCSRPLTAHKTAICPAVPLTAMPTLTAAPPSNPTATRSLGRRRSARRPLKSCAPP